LPFKGKREKQFKSRAQSPQLSTMYTLTTNLTSLLYSKIKIKHGIIILPTAWFNLMFIFLKTSLAYGLHFLL